MSLHDKDNEIINFIKNFEEYQKETEILLFEKETLINDLKTENNNIKLYSEQNDTNNKNLINEINEIINKKEWDIKENTK